MTASTSNALPRELTVGQVAERSGVAVSTLHFYESKGLIASRRNGSNHRRYPREVLRRIAVIRVAQRAGMSLASIRDALASLPNGRTPTAADWKRLSAQWQAELDARIAHLVDLRDRIGCGCLSVKTCPLRNPSDELSEEGAGARLLSSVQ